MRPNPFDVFSGFDTEPTETGTTFIGIVKKYMSDTKSCMVLVPEIDDSEVLGPFRIMRSFSSLTSFIPPSVNDKVVVAFLDGSLDNAVLLGVLL